MPAKITDQQSQRTKIALGYDPKGIDASITLFPIANSRATGVAIKVGRKTLKSQLCPTKQDIINFISEVL